LTLDAEVRQAEFVDDGTRIAALTFGMLALWPVDGGAQMVITPNPRLRGFAVPRGVPKLVTAGQDHTVRVHDLTGSETDRVLASYSGEINDLVISGDGTLAASASQEGEVGVQKLDGTLART